MLQLDMYFNPYKGEIEKCCNGEIIHQNISDVNISLFTYPPHRLTPRLIHRLIHRLIQGINTRINTKK